MGQDIFYDAKDRSHLYGLLKQGFCCLTNHLHCYSNAIIQACPPYDGRIAIIDFTGEGWFQQLFGHYTSSEIIQRKLQEAGYTLEAKLEFLPTQVFLIFVRNQQ